MPVDIKVDYPEVLSAAQRFESEVERIKQIIHHLQHGAEKLRGGWVGQGAQTFQQEMATLILPEFQRLAAAVQATGSVLKQVSQIFSEAELEAAGYIKLQPVRPGKTGERGEAIRAANYPGLPAHSEAPGGSRGDGPTRSGDPGGGAGDHSTSTGPEVFIAWPTLKPLLYVTEGVNFRSDHDASSEKIGSYAAGTPVEDLGETYIEYDKDGNEVRTWHKVRVGDKVGWMTEDCLSATVPPDLSTIPNSPLLGNVSVTQTYGQVLDTGGLHPGIDIVSANPTVVTTYTGAVYLAQMCGDQIYLYDPAHPLQATTDGVWLHGASGDISLPAQAVVRREDAPPEMTPPVVENYAGDWSYVSYTDATGKVQMGWVASEYLGPLPVTGFGNLIIQDTGQGYEILGHCQDFNNGVTETLFAAGFQQGMVVPAGTPVGLIGEGIVGHSTGPHIHEEMREYDSLTINPAQGTVTWGEAAFYPPDATDLEAHYDDPAAVAAGTAAEK